MGNWLHDPLRDIEQSTVASPNTVDSKSLRERLAANRLAIRVYNWITPAYYSWRLRNNSSSIFHAPNYIVPPFAGRTVSTVHDLSHILHPEFHPRARVDYLKQTLTKSLSRTDHVITVSETVRQEILDRGMLAPEKVTAIHLAADPIFRPHTLDMLSPAMEALGLQAGQYSLFVGTVEPRKNVARLIQAYKALPKPLRMHYPLVIAGGKGWNSENTHALIAQSQEEGWLRYLSFVDQRWLPALYAGARLMAYPSLYEGFGLPIVESMACGTPVLTSNTSCMPEVSAGAARLINPLDVEEMGHALQDCLTNELWQSSARALGITRAANLSWDRCAQQTINVYKNLN